MAQEHTLNYADPATGEIEVCKIGLDDLWQALKKGFADFNAKPSHIVFLCVFYPLFAVLLTLFLVGENILHLAFPIVSGFALIGPVVSVVFFEMSRRRESGLDVTWGSAFGFVHSPSFAPILALSVAMMLLYLAQLIYFGLFGAVR